MHCIPGICLDENGSDVNDGISTFPEFGYQQGNNSAEECLASCQMKWIELGGKITACEYRNDNVDMNVIDVDIDIRVSRCLAHTLPISDANGKQTDTCCIYGKYQP